MTTASASASGEKLGRHARACDSRSAQPVLQRVGEPSPPVEIPEHSWAALHHVQDPAILVDQFVGILERPPNHSSCERGVGHRAACLGARGLPELRLVLCLLKAKGPSQYLRSELPRFSSRQAIPLLGPPQQWFFAEEKCRVELHTNDLVADV